MKWKKWALVVTKSVFLTGGLVVIGVSSGYWLGNYSDYSLDFSKNQKVCGVVFGAAVWRDNKPSHALYDRTMTGVDLYQSGKLNCLVFSGGASRYGAHEVDVMRDLALSSGVEESDVFLDYEGKNTRATIENLKKFSDISEAQWVLVTNDFHLFRTRYFLWKNSGNFFDIFSERARYFQGRYYKEPYFFVREVGAMFYYAWWEILGIFVIIFSGVFWLVGRVYTRGS